MMFRAAYNGGGCQTAMIFVLKKTATLGGRLLIQFSASDNGTVDRLDISCDFMQIMANTPLVL